MKKIWLIIPVLAVSAIYNSCSNNHLPPDSGVCFESKIKPIIVNNCAITGCHDAQSHKEGLDLSTYKGIKEIVNISSPSNSRLVKYMSRTDNERMPPAPASAISAENQALILQWIEEGAYNSTNCATSSCDTTAFTYTAVIKPIMETNCLGSGCHNATDKKAGYDLSTYAGVKNCVDGGLFVSSIIQDGNASNMPKGGNKLGTCDITKIQKWVAAGAPNN